MSNDTATAPAITSGDIAYTVNAGRILPTAPGVRVRVTEVRRHSVTGELAGYLAEVTDENAPEGDDGREIVLRADELDARPAPGTTAAVVEALDASLLDPRRGQQDDYRLVVLTAAADAVLARHTALVVGLNAAIADGVVADRHERPLDVSPAAALAVVLHELGAHFSVNLPGSRGPYTAADYREVALSAWARAGEIIPGIVAERISAARRRASLSY